MGEKTKQMKVYTVIEKPGSQRGVWLEIGIASKNRDGSISARLDAVPMNGTLQLRDDGEERAKVDTSEKRASRILGELHNLIENSEWNADLRQVLVDVMEAWACPNQD